MGRYIVEIKSAIGAHVVAQRRRSLAETPAADLLDPFAESVTILGHRFQ
jgi:hypothetical protein